MKSAPARNAVEATLESIEKRVPAYGDLARRFGPLFLLRASLRDGLDDARLAKPEVDGAKLSAGIPILAGCDLSMWKAEFAKTAMALLPMLAESLGLDDAQRSALDDFLRDPEHVLGLVQARIDGNWKHFENTSKQWGAIPDTVLLYVSENVCSPVLSAVARSLGESLSDNSWDQGNCPVCGSTPSISQLSPREVTDLDHLVGGGGKKYLHCSLCGHDWRFKRNACAACGNDENESREVFFKDDVKHERIEACHKCGTYCLNIDLRECDAFPDLDTAQLGLIHLDIHARSKDLSPMTPTLWNTVEP